MGAALVRSGVVMVVLGLSMTGAAVFAQTGPTEIIGEWCGKWRTKTQHTGDFCVRVERVSPDRASGSYDVMTVVPAGMPKPMSGRFQGTLEGTVLSFKMAGKVPVVIEFKGDFARGTMDATHAKTVELGRMK